MSSSNTNFHDINWNNVLSITQQWKHLRRRKFVKKLKRCAKRKALAIAEKSRLITGDNSCTAFASKSIAMYHGFKPVYDCVVEETVFLLLETLVSSVSENEVFPENISAISSTLDYKSTAAQSSVSSETVDMLSVASIKCTSKLCSANVLQKEETVLGAKNDNSVKIIETEKFLVELDEEVQNWHNPFLPEHTQNKVIVELPKLHSPKSPKLNNSENSLNGQNTAERELKQICHFYDKVGSCRFGDNCSRYHNIVDCGNTLLLKGMFSTFAFDIVERAQKTSQGDIDDLWLEYSDADLYDEFVEFYNDVIPELETYGKVIQFKVCCNRDKHLLGNVYVQYKHKKDARKAANHLNGRFYNGKPLNVKFVKIKSWKSAICGLHYNNRNCPRGYHCNFLHVFKEPSRRFLEADIDTAIFKYKERDYFSDRNPAIHSKKLNCRETSHKAVSASLYLRSPELKRRKKLSKKQKSKHRKSKKHSRRHACEKDDCDNS